MDNTSEFHNSQIAKSIAADSLNRKSRKSLSIAAGSALLFLIITFIHSYGG